MTIAVPVESPPATRRQWTGRAVTRLATVGDQLLVALANFAVTLSIGRAFGAEDVAAYGIGLSAALMFQGFQRHAMLIPLMLQPSARVLGRRGAIFAQHGLILATFILLGLAGLLLARQTGMSRFGCLTVASSGVCLLIYAQLEFARAILVKLERPFLLFASASWYAAISAGLALAALYHMISFEGLLAAVAVAMLIHAATLFGLARDFSLRRGWILLIADLRRYGAWAMVAIITYSGYSHIPLFILGAVAAPIHAAAFVATRSLLQPLQILLRGFDAADKAMFSERAGAPNSRNAFTLTIRLALLYAAAALLLGGLAGIFADDILRLAYGEKFAGFGAALLAWIPVYAVLSVSLPFESLVYSRRIFRAYYLVRGIGSLLAIALTGPLILPWAEVGAIAACGIGSLLAVAGTIVILLQEPRR